MKFEHGFYIANIKFLYRRIKPLIDKKILRLDIILVSEVEVIHWE